MNPPVAKRVDTTRVHHDDVFVDPTNGCGTRPTPR